MKHYYENVPRLGNVAVSRHAQSQMLDAGISQEAFDRALLDPTQPDAPDGQDILWRERDGLRLVILTNPTPNRGAKLSYCRMLVTGWVRRQRVGLLG
jgi:hypothetical protein